jgi:hypothetical protein
VHGAALISRRKLIAVLEVIAAFALLAACGGGGGGATGGSGGGVQPPAAGDLQVTVASVPAQATHVDPRATLRVNFSDSLAPDSVSASAVELTSGGVAIAATVSVQGGTLTVTPSAPLRLGTSFEPKVQAGVRSSDGLRALKSDYVLSFTTDPVYFETRHLVAPDTQSLRGAPTCIAVADVNGDGRADIVTLSELPPAPAGSARLGNSLHIYEQDAQGGFAEKQRIDHVLDQSTYVQYFANVVLVDLDGDGRPEMVVPQYGLDPSGPPSGLRVFRRDANGQFVAGSFVPTRCAQALVVADIDGDGRLDLLGSYHGLYGAAFQVFLNPGTGLIAKSALSLPLGAQDFALADLDHDGRCHYGRRRRLHSPGRWRIRTRTANVLQRVSTDIVRRRREPRRIDRHPDRGRDAAITFWHQLRVCRSGSERRRIRLLEHVPRHAARHTPGSRCGRSRLGRGRMDRHRLCGRQHRH